MGLDQYICAETGEEESLELAYWRKHPNLHGWFIDKLANGNHDSNCERLYMTLDTLHEVMQAVENYNLPKTSGFFFGASYMDRPEKDYTLTQLEKVKKYMLDNPSSKVYYFAWW